VATDGQSIVWSWTDTLVKTDFTGRLLVKVPADTHHGDLCTTAGKVFVAVNLGKFNMMPGAARSWVYEYEAATLQLLQKHPVPEAVHGAGGIAEHDGRFIVVGGLPPEVPENYLYEYDRDFHFVTRHVLPSGYTTLGIQTATWANGAWWFGCYGSPAVVLRADADFKLTGRWNFNASLGLEGLDGRFLVGRNTPEKSQAHTGRVIYGREDPVHGLVLEKP
jgi:hypothetical protein